MDEDLVARAMRRRGKETSDAERMENKAILDKYENMNNVPDTDIGKTDINWKPYSEGPDEPYQKGGRRRRKSRRQRKSRSQRKSRRAR